MEQLVLYWAYFLIGASGTFIGFCIGTLTNKVSEIEEYVNNF